MEISGMGTLELTGPLTKPFCLTRAVSTHTTNVNLYPSSGIATADPIIQVDMHPVRIRCF